MILTFLFHSVVFFCTFNEFIKQFSCCSIKNPLFRIFPVKSESFLYFYAVCILPQYAPVLFLSASALAPENASSGIPLSTVFR